MTYYQILNKKGGVVAGNILQTQDLSTYSSREISILGGNATPRLFSNEKVLKRAKFFRTVSDLCAPIIESLYKRFTEQIEAHSHTLRKLQAQSNQKIEGIIPDYMLIFSVDYEEQHKRVEQEIRKNARLAADTFIYLKKRIFELDAHIQSFEIIHLGADISLDVRAHNIKRLILNAFHVFDERLREISVRMIIAFEDSYAEEHKIKLDYKTFNTALYNFFDNTLKYIMPGSELRISFDINEHNEFHLSISMMSLRIEHDEGRRILQLGERGKNAEHIEGTGVGLYVISEIMRLNNFNFEINSEYSKMKVFEEQQYILNYFDIRGHL